MAHFIDVTLDAAQMADRGKDLVRVCPVDIFRWDENAGRAVLVPDNFDECTLCELCLAAAPGAVQVKKLY